MKARFLATAFALAAATLAVATPSFAFCRATTCDASKKDCARDSQGCLTEGKPLYWASSCLEVHVQGNGSVAQGISFATLGDRVSGAFGTWLSSDCGGAPPLLDVHVLGPITCDVSEYNSTKKNANIVMFRDDRWPYMGAEDALAFTHLVFNPDTGELWDSDLEINGFEYQFSIGDPVTANDLDSMLTHEVGHMLGLAHTLVADATMFAQYEPGSSTPRSLTEDDTSAICASYAPDRVPSRTSCSPRHGFSDRCAAEQPENSATNEGTENEVAGKGSDPTSKGCALASDAGDSKPGIPGALLSALATLGLFARRQRSHHRFVA
ncbi:MAG TPA: matrixin family metalloprotease [Polyangiaceae bacterium]|nr:matrixin family metalloprotease [Polyangiaceae bacterium]